MKNISIYDNKTFESIKHIDETGIEYWDAKEFQKILEYKTWKKFKKVILRAQKACELSKNIISNHFCEQYNNYKLSRYACYLIIQNADSRKKAVSLGKTYFAIQTMKSENLEKDDSDLATRLFIMSQVESKMKRDNIKEENKTELYEKFESIIRKTIKEIN